MFLSRLQAADLLQISAETLDRHRKKGSVNYLKLGHRIFFLEKDISDFIDKCRVKGNKEVV